ncbi:MAG: hypothetical protein A3G34_06040 [Candidatus Lindowbacteria bacterium RIFCSPLOWO2_12_FULL_62_27]|nr:MAG: hypothetical protein A3G34_06040 [Candidatus Lindowbacteria bacterium RIFCSPLOWO2_12_FULL_62_27]
MLKMKADEHVRPVLRIIGLLTGYSVALAGLKLWMGHMAVSEAVRSDGWNNFADALYSVLLGIGFYIAAKAPDESHPHGHRRFESMIGLVVGIVILATGGYILIECRRRWLDSAPPVLHVGILAGLAALLASKLWMARLCRRTGERHHRPALIAVGKDQQMDMYATMSALVGYGGGAWGAPILDPVFGAVISLWVFKVGGETIAEHVHQLTGRTAPPEIRAAIARAVDESPVLFGMNDLRTHLVGPEIQVSLNVFAHKTITLEAAHDAEEDLKARIARIPGVSAVFIHIEPHEERKKVE